MRIFLYDLPVDVHASLTPPDYAEDGAEKLETLTPQHQAVVRGILDIQAPRMFAHVSLLPESFRVVFTNDLGESRTTCTVFQKESLQLQDVQSDFWLNYFSNQLSSYKSGLHSQIGDLERQKVNLQRVYQVLP